MFLKKATLALTVGVASMSAAWALPDLQLDIPGGTYNTIDETTYAGSADFTLRALSQISSGTFYISAAVVPMQGSTPPPNIGTFTVNGANYSAGNMQWGTPPVDAVSNSKDLPSHSIFPTYFLELAFNFDPAKTVAAYNTADGSAAPGSLFYNDFAFNVSGLADGFALHFDLYNDINGQVGIFAPFSHDAQSGGTVPDGGSSLAMLGLVLVGAEGLRRKLIRR